MKTPSNTVNTMHLRHCIDAELAGDQRIAAAFVLGSAFRGDMRPESDIDIALLLTPGAELDAQDRVGLAVRLGKALLRDVDLGILSPSNLIYAKEAYLNGECIYCRDTLYRDTFGTSVLGLYLELRESRKEVECAYQT